MAVQDVLGGSLAWVADPAPGPVKLLTYRHPDVPNLGDITAVDWAAVGPVGVITGGSPCPGGPSGAPRGGGTHPPPHHKDRRDGSGYTTLSS